MARRALAVLLLTMLGFQVVDLDGFVDVLTTYELGGRAAATATAIALLGAQAWAGLGLLGRSPARRSTAAVVAVGVAVAWSALAIQAFARGLAIGNCGCFGVYLAQPLRWWVLVQDAVFVAWAWVVLRSTHAAPAGTHGVGATTVEKAR